MKAILTLVMSLIFISGCKVSYKKSHLEDGSSVAAAGIYLNTKVCLEGAYLSEGPLVMSTTLNSLDMIPTVTPYQSTAPWYHYSFNDLTLTPEILALGVFVDWVLVEVYQDVNGTMTYRDGQSALIHENGTIYDSGGFQGILFPSLAKGNYYINIIHRNHLSIGSNSYVYLSEAFDDATYNIDFTNLGTAYLTGGASTTKGAATQCLAVGDLDGNLLVDVADETEIWTSISAVVSGPLDNTAILGYNKGDVDFDGITKMYDGHPANVLTNQSSDLLSIQGNSGTTTVIHD